MAQLIGTRERTPASLLARAIGLAPVMASLATIASGCGASTPQVATDHTSTSAVADATVTSVAHANAHDRTAISITKAVLRTGPDQITAAVTLRGPLSAKDRGGQNCRSVGVAFQDQKLEMQNLARFNGNTGYNLVPQPSVTVSYPNSRTVLLVVRRAALGDQFTVTEPWFAYSYGPGCPPMATAADVVGPVTPHA